MEITEIQIMLSLAGTSLGLLVTVLTVIVKFVKNAKLKRAMEQAIEISNSVIPYIKEAEKFTAFSGEEKKAYVMTKANQLALANGMPFNEEQISEKVEELVALTKQVNVKLRAKEKEQIAEEIKVITEKNKNLTTEKIEAAAGMLSVEEVENKPEADNPAATATWL